LYTNIPHNEGIESLKQALNTRKTKEVSTDFLVKLLSLVLKHNIFEFNGKYYQQQIGTAMGTRVAPTMANIFMASIDNLIQSLSVTENLNYIHFYKRFIDDIFIIWTGSKEDLNLFMSKINDLHKSIKFTCDYDLSKRSTTFLDTTISLIDNELNSDLYRKPTDRVQYLLPNSCHPNHIFKNVPYSLALRILRICSKKDDLEKRLEELQQSNTLNSPNSPKTQLKDPKPRPHQPKNTSRGLSSCQVRENIVKLG
jgi:hypothetical protein